MIRGLIQPNMIGDTYAITLLMEVQGSSHRILRLGGTERYNLWEPYDPERDFDTPPTMRLGLPEICALDDAIGQIRHGSGDVRSLRADLAHERTRRDKVDDAIIAIALRSASVPFEDGLAVPIGGGRR
jgi:hypothetical protein